MGSERRATIRRTGKLFTYTVNEDGRVDAYLADSATRHGSKINLAPGLNSYSGQPAAFPAPGEDGCSSSIKAQRSPPTYGFMTSINASRAS